MSLRDKKVKVEWVVEDGYAGKSRPQDFEVNVEDFEGLVPGDSEIEDVIYEFVQEEFSNRIGFAVTNLDNVVAEIERVLAEHGEG